MHSHSETTHPGHPTDSPSHCQPSNQLKYKPAANDLQASERTSNTKQENQNVQTGNRKAYRKWIMQLEEKQNKNYN
jgi:hypothetical protein